MGRCATPWLLSIFSIGMKFRVGGGDETLS
jgi:hypothetical protein